MKIKMCIITFEITEWQAFDNELENRRKNWKENKFNLTFEPLSISYMFGGTYTITSSDGETCTIIRNHVKSLFEQDRWKVYTYSVEEE